MKDFENIIAEIMIYLILNDISIFFIELSDEIKNRLLSLRLKNIKKLLHKFYIHFKLIYL